jgi:gas vesicle protein
MSNHNVLFAFIGGALIGAIAALLLAPESGADFRSHIKEVLKSKGINLPECDLDELIKKLSNRT